MKRSGPANTVGVSTRWMKLPRAIMEKSAEEARRLSVPSLPLRPQGPAWPSACGTDAAPADPARHSLGEVPAIRRNAWLNALVLA